MNEEERMTPVPETEQTEETVSAEEIPAAEIPSAEIPGTESPAPQAAPYGYVQPGYSAPPQGPAAAPYRYTQPQGYPVPPQGTVPVQPPQPTYGYPQSYGYTPPAYPQKPPMKTGVKVLIGVLIALFVLTIGGFGAYMVYDIAENLRDPIFYEDNYNYFGDSFDDYFGDPEEGDHDFYNRGDYFPDPEVSDGDFVPPDIDVIPNTEGILLHATPTGPELDISAVYEKVIPATVLVTLPEEGSSGTGIIASEDGYIITNSHVVLDTRTVRVEVKTYDGETHEAVVVGCDKATDLAVLKIDGSGYTPAEFGDSDELTMGQWVVAIGNPGGEMFSGSITRGIISGLDREVGSYSANGMTYIQTDAAINPGNSGGPLMNLYGQVVAINSAKIVSSEYEGMGFAIPITGAKRILDDLLSGGYVSGRVRFGIQGYALSMMQAEAAEVPQGFLIATIDEDSSFVGTGVQEYDIITAVDGQETPTLQALSNALLAYKPGDEVEVTLFRPYEDRAGGEEFTVTVTLLADMGETQ